MISLPAFRRSVTWFAPVFELFRLNIKRIYPEKETKPWRCIKKCRRDSQKYWSFF